MKDKLKEILAGLAGLGLLGAFAAALTLALHEIIPALAWAVSHASWQDIGLFLVIFGALVVFALSPSKEDKS